MPYHASTYPLALAPWPTELLGHLDRDYGTSPTSPRAAVIDALVRAGHDPATPYGQRVLGHHAARRHEALTGLPF